ncbi:hypothetical protein AVEN_207646-1 [Araneus ventricosus]|uniref:Uncharacterized protein n=1 Tax=Araneus ventricosus TaxID=182803 RepID=A0A4Y2LW86_ARAVE|nr:hypothetical protein AVEN_191300-1 [Araneus ventricosus]GBN19097.1 hypothetical protein AVEN_52288-1 [Araneus ventricosus]GBN19119.1 hypothetical protein AVEN_153844-1 [Araneus ventricosus]GBN19137.1 hypothetical protein AVEN_207646-1 [Araneus ventricosus]
MSTLHAKVNSDLTRAESSKELLEGTMNISCSREKAISINVGDQLTQVVSPQAPPRRSLANGVLYHLSFNLWLIRSLQKDFRMKEDVHYGAYFDENVFKISVNVYISIDAY